MNKFLRALIWLRAHILWFLFQDCGFYCRWVVIPDEKSLFSYYADTILVDGVRFGFIPEAGCPIHD